MDSEPELLGDEPVRLPRAGREPGAREHEVLDAEPRELWHVPWRIVLPVVLVLEEAGVTLAHGAAMVNAVDPEVSINEGSLTVL